MTPAVERIALAPGYEIPRLIVGLWQLSAGHSAGATATDPARWLGELVDAGFDTFDCADIYTGVEETLGRFVATRPPGAVRVHTKLVPDLPDLVGLDRAHVTRIVERSLGRLGVERLDLVQFHWWDFAIPGWIDALGWLEELRDEGKVRLVGVTNFDAARLQELLDAGVRPAADQVQYSLLDRRPAPALAPLALARGVELLTYGTLAGGLLSERWRHVGSPPGDWPDRSLQKYGLIVDDAGGWLAYQALLEVLAAVAADHGVGLGAVAMRWVLERPGVGALVVGARHAGHAPAWKDAVALRLEAADRCRIEGALETIPGPPGQVYELEREAGGRHAAIMRTRLNRESEQRPDPNRRGSA